jgi:eukaryotic-like serine/threonine-protein kinase
MPIPAGTQIGDCEILALLGAGGMGEVYRARDHSLGREVALKVLPEALASDAERMRRFEQEARAAAALNHPNIVAVYRFGTTGAHLPYLITELLEGQSLRERLKQGPIPVRKCIDHALQTARGLAAAHERGFVHRDLKPENLFLTRDGLVKILDFGLAKLIEINDSPSQNTMTMYATTPGIVLGTLGYMSPEQVRAQALDHRSDIFSLGAILYEMLCGQRAFAGTTSADVMSAILKEEPAELAPQVRNLPPALGRIAHRCLEKEPAERFQSARDLAFNLELLTRDETGSGAVALAAPAQKSTWPISVLSTLALLAAVGLGMTLQRILTPRPKIASPVVLRRLTDFVGMEESPALSPDGKAVAFTADLAGQRQVWVRLLAGGAPLQVTHDSSDHQFPRWSPDSASLIYFSPSAEPNGQGQIWEIPALGGPARPIVSSLTGGDVSHDGKSIAYFHPSQGQIELTIADRDGSNSRALARFSPKFTYSDLRWSPDDRLLGFQKGRVFNYDIFFVPVSGGEARKITQDSMPLAGFAWLPDSSGIVYSSSRGDTILYLPTMNFWSVHIDGSHLRQLTFGETSYVAPDVDGNRNVVASRSRAQFDVWKFPVGDNPQENVARGVPITHQTGAVQTPSVGVNDQEIAYLSDSGGHGNIWILDVQSGRSRQITFEQDARIGLGVPVWSPDGGHIAYVTRSRTGWNVDLWMVNPDGRNAHKVSSSGGWATWSPDSRWLYFAEPNSEGQFSLKKLSSDGGTIRDIREGERPAVSADGTLYFSVESANVNGTSDLEIFKARPENGVSTLLTRISSTRLPAWMMIQPVLSPDGKWLAMTLADGSTTNIWAQPSAGGAMRRITDFGHQPTLITRRVSWSVDGNSIYAAVGKAEADIVQLSNLVP